MAIVATDWTITRATKVVAYTGDDHGGAAPSYATVIEFHRWLQGLADDEVAIPSSSDELDMSNPDPSKRSTDNIITLINGYTIGNTEHEHLYDGSIIQSGGDTIYEGVVNFGPPSVQIQIIQDGAVLADDWWNFGGGGLNPNATAGISHRFMIKVRDNGVDIDGRRLIGICRTLDDTNQNTYAEFSINGTSRGNNVLALSDTADLNNPNTATTISGFTGISNTEGLRSIDVDDNGTPELYYSEWVKGSNSINDFYEYMKWVTRAGSGSTIHGINGELFRGITHSFAYSGATGTNPVTNDEIAWGTNIVFTSGGTFTVGEAIHEDTATPLWKGRIIAIDDNTGSGSIIASIETGTVTSAQTFTGKTSTAGATVSGTPAAVTGGGTFRVFAINDSGATGTIYGQVMRGTAPPASAIMYDDLNVANNLAVSGSPTVRAISTPFCGASTGTALISSYGFSLQQSDLTKSDKITDLTGTVNTPPNLVTNTVGGLTFGANPDRVLVAPWDGASYDVNGDPVIDKGQLLLSTALTADNITSVVVKAGTEAAIPSDTPKTVGVGGYIRVVDNNGFERRLHYTTWDDATDTFTIDTTDGNEDFASVNASADNQVYIAYLDQNAAAATATYQAVHTTGTRSLVVLVRNGGASPIKQFIAEWSFIASNQTINKILVSDL
jgi:hypothetical protein